jgi:serine/tyrosine/threonine adenylyltransferase
LGAEENFPLTLLPLIYLLAMTPHPTVPVSGAVNPLLSLNYEPAFESLGADYADPVVAAEFPQQILRFRNNDVLRQIGLDPAQVSDADVIQAFGRFEGRSPLLAMCYHGYQFGEYNPRLGDGRGFLQGQVRGQDGRLYDFGTKGSGPTPYSRGGDGRLTLKGGVREVLASEALHHLGVTTSRCMSLIETGEALWRGDEPSPTRASVMVRFSHSHIRFGTFERLHALRRPDLIQKLLDHVIQVYYPDLESQPDRYILFYAELVKRTASLVAEWMSVGFCHAVLNTDNMSITGESFDYGPFAFINSYEPTFTAAYFDHYGRYAYANQPGICEWNLEMLQRPLAAVIPQSELETALKAYGGDYATAYRLRMLQRLGFEQLGVVESEELIYLTLEFLYKSQISYHQFFAELRQQFSALWRADAGHVFQDNNLLTAEKFQALEPWRSLYHRLLKNQPETELAAIADRLQRHNPLTVIVRPEIEAVWEAISAEDNWQPFYALLKRLQTLS